MMLPIRLTFAVQAVAVALTGCSEQSPDETTTEPNDTSCHHDCFGYLTCVEGVVTRYLHLPVPCASWRGECPHEVAYTCERSCSTPIEKDYSASPDSLCEEGRPKSVGDPCAVESDCEPQIAVIGADHSVTNVYLRCDAELGQCVAREPPHVADWLEPCGLSVPFGVEDGHEFGFVRSSLCDGGLCLIAEQDSCIQQGCTTPCDSDDDCPMGAICQENMGDWTQTPGQRYFGSVCKPGPHNRIGVDLSCVNDTRD